MLGGCDLVLDLVLILMHAELSTAEWNTMLTSPASQRRRQHAPSPRVPSGVRPRVRASEDAGRIVEAKWGRGWLLCLMLWPALDRTTDEQDNP